MSCANALSVAHMSAMRDLTSGGMSTSSLLRCRCHPRTTNKLGSTTVFRFPFLCVRLCLSRCETVRERGFAVTDIM